MLVPLWLQANMGYTATWAGYISGMTGILAVVGAPIAAKLSGQARRRAILVFAGVMWLACVTFMRAGATSQMDFWQIAFWPLRHRHRRADVLPAAEHGGAGQRRSRGDRLGGGPAQLPAHHVRRRRHLARQHVWENNATRNQAELAGALHGAEAALSAMQQPG